MIPIVYATERIIMTAYAIIIIAYATVLISRCSYTKKYLFE